MTFNLTTFASQHRMLAAAGRAGCIRRCCASSAAELVALRWLRALFDGLRTTCLRRLLHRAPAHLRRPLRLQKTGTTGAAPQHGNTCFLDAHLQELAPVAFAGRWLIFMADGHPNKKQLEEKKIKTPRRPRRSSRTSRRRSMMPRRPRRSSSRRIRSRTRAGLPPRAAAAAAAAAPRRASRRPISNRSTHQCRHRCHLAVQCVVSEAPHRRVGTPAHAHLRPGELRAAHAHDAP